MEQDLPRITPEDNEIVWSHAVLRIREIRLGGTPRGAVIVLCESGGLEDAAETMNRLAFHGYESVAADLPLPLPDRAMVDGEWRSGVAALLARLGVHGWDTEQIGIIGYGAGGRVALLAAAEFAAGAAVSITTSDFIADLMTASAPILTPWLGMVGEYDDICDRQSQRRLNDELARRSTVFTQVVCYPDVGERFYRDGPDPTEHAAAFDCWQRTVEWLERRVVPRLTAEAHRWRARQPASLGAP